MEETYTSSKKNNRAIKFYAIFSLVAIAIFTSIIIGGFFDTTFSKLKSLATTLSSGVASSSGYLGGLSPFSQSENYPTNSFIIPQIIMGDNVVTQVRGNVTLKAKISSDNVMFVVKSSDDLFSKVFTIEDGVHKSNTPGYYEYNLDTKILSGRYFNFKAAYRTQDNAWSYTAKTPFYVVSESYPVISTSTTPNFSTSTSTSSPLTSTSSPGIVTTTSTPISVALSPVVNQVSDFDITKTYPRNLSIFPTILKDNVRVYNNVSGTVSFHLEISADKVVMLIGTKDGWMTDAIIGQTNGLLRAPGTSRWSYNFDSKKYKDGYYRVGAAYFDSNKGWLTISSLDFNIKNIIEQEVKPIIVTTVTTSTPTTAPLIDVKVEKTLPVQEPVKYQAVISTTTKSETVVVKETFNQEFKPVLRLVVNDRQISDLKHTFDSEELELRVTALPARYVQFFAYAVDGAFKPVLKEIGKGGKDEVLSREDKEVWTYTTDMSQYPTGNFRLFARVTDISGKVLESQSISIVVQHLMQMGNNMEEATATVEEVALETKQSILRRVTDPSACQNRQECEVFCSSSNSAESKCLNFVRATEKTNTTTTLSLIETNKEETISKVSLILPDLAERISELKSGKVGNNSSSTTQIEPILAINLVAPVSTGRASLMDIIPTPVIENIISVKDKIDVFFPEGINNVSDIQQFCGSVENEDVCSKTINKIVPELKDNVKKQSEVIKQEEAKVVDMLDKRSGARTYIDTDNDGITDFDEINIYHTNPAKRDTNGDGYSDGASILSQMSPLAIDSNASQAKGKIQLAQGLSVENPKITGTTQKKQFEVTSIAPLDFMENSEGKKEISKVAFKGIALPNSFVKIFLFSDPLVVTVKTDDSGNWSYVLDKTLPDGTHTAYVAMTDGGGRILAKSEPLPFVKEASAITINAAAVANPSDNQNTIMGLSPVTLIALFVGLLGLALSVVGVVIGFKNHDKPNLTLSA